MGEFTPDQLFKNDFPSATSPGLDEVIARPERRSNFAQGNGLLAVKEKLDFFGSIIWAGPEQRPRGHPKVLSHVVQFNGNATIIGVIQTAPISAELLYVLSSVYRCQPRKEASKHVISIATSCQRGFLFRVEHGLPPVLSDGVQ